MLLHKSLLIELWEADQPPQEHYKQNPHFEILKKKKRKKTSITLYYFVNLSRKTNPSNYNTKKEYSDYFLNVGMATMTNSMIEIFLPFNRKL